MLEGLSTSVLALILFLLFLLSAFFSGSETALMSANRYQLTHLAAQGNKNAKRVLKLLERPDRLIGLILIGNNFTNIVITQLATYIGYRLYGNLGIAIATGILTFLILIFAELTPKTLAAAHPNPVSLFVSVLYTPLMIAAYPLVWSVNLFANALLKLFGVSQQREPLNPLSREELRTLLSVSKHRISDEYETMLLGILDLEQRTVEDIMIPRNEIQGIDLNNDWDEIEDQMLNSLYTRIPIYDGDINRTLGILHIRDLLPIVKMEEPDKETLIEAAREPFYLPEHTSLRHALVNFKSYKRRISLVVDEYGDIQGLITLEDLLEQIVGEFTNDPGTYDLDIKRQKDGSVIVDGGCRIRDLNRIMKWEFDEKQAKTINGLIIENMENIPEAGTGILINNHPIEIIKTYRNAVCTVKISPPLIHEDPALQP